MGLVYTPELADRATAWLARPLTNDAAGKRSAEGLLELATIWAAVQGLPLPECIRQCQYSERAQALRTYLTDFSRLQNPALMSDSKYQFAPAYQDGSYISDDRYGKKVTAENLTDEDAEQLIKLGHGHIIIAKASTALSAAPTEVVAEKPLVPQADLEAEQAAHEATKRVLATEKQGYERALSDCNKANGARTKAEGALTSEKKAHEATKQQLSEVQKQLAEAQATIAQVATPLAATPVGDAPAA